MPVYLPKASNLKKKTVMLTVGSGSSSRRPGILVGFQLSPPPAPQDSETSLPEAVQKIGKINLD